MKYRQALIVFWLGCELLVRSCLAQPLSLEFGPDGEDDPPVTAEGFTVSSFEVKGRWLGAFPLPLKVGDVWSVEKQSEVLNAIRTALSGEDTASFLVGRQGEARVFYVDVLEVKDEAARTVKLTFRPFNVHVSLAKVGDNVLPIPRSPFATHYNAVPAPLLALNPTVGMSYDRAFGTALLGSFDTDLLTLNQTARGELPSPSPQNLDARFSGAKSFEEYYRANAGLRYSVRHTGATLAEMFLSGDYTGVNEPLAHADHTEQSAAGHAGAAVRLGAHTRIHFNAGYARSWDAVEMSGDTMRTATHVQPNRILADSLLPRPFGGFLRAAIWEDNGWTDRGIGAHQRLIGRIGYAREFSISPNQTIGLELIAGGGRLWGDAPAQRRFFGGNSPVQFLYDNPSGPGLITTPGGPLIRSLGEAEANGERGRAVGGGDAFWHVNANLTIPIRPWSRPLIPDEPEIREMLRNGIFVSGRNFLVTALKNQGMPREAAIAEADRTFDEIRPATEFIIDEANLYAVKPLLMLDAAGLRGDRHDTWLAAGGGVQVTIVTAKFELGYMHTLRGPVDEDRGNFFARLVFQNLF